MSEAEPQNLRECYQAAEKQRKQLDSAAWSATVTSEQVLNSTIIAYEKCVQVASDVSLFSPNETLEDVASADLRYLLLHFRLAELLQQLTQGSRQEILHRARSEHEWFLQLIYSYRMLSPENSKLYEQYQDCPDSFSTAPLSDATARRNTKIARFRAEKLLRSKIEVRHAVRVFFQSTGSHTLKLLEKSPQVLSADDAAFRALHLSNVDLSVHQSFQSLEAIAQELHILAQAPAYVKHSEDATDSRARPRERSSYSERLDQFQQTSKGQGPILDAEGKLLRPFTLLDKRRSLQQGVFRPDHSLPTMSIEEYLEEEKRRGGIIEGGGPDSAIKAEVDEEDHNQLDLETLKQRQWDDWKDDNPRGAGNTLNRG